MIVRFAPVLSGTTEGLIIALVGGTTFALASFIAISQNNAKKVLTYSTIANLGLIVACAGVGTYNLMWVAILLIIFHAIARSLMFLCVGTVEHRIGSRNIEDMGGLIVRMPKLAIMMFIGMAGMFLALLVWPSPNGQRSRRLSRHLSVYVDIRVTGAPNGEFLPERNSHGGSSFTTSRATGQNSLSGRGSGHQR
jgi:hypothetical protein